ncbi:MAG TPA: gliding motility-associated C-terminal domain-containing protein, partial [Cytophagaceae bacterium]|nr:gliding motility-associated C-terminal domain-containing protein [Cytophagaceae bacterium]
LGGKITATATNTSNKSTSGFATSANVFDCSAVSANAGSDTTMCTGTNFYLNGKIINADSLIWTTSGTGKFADSSYYKTSYTPSSTDIAAGSVTITLKTLAGTCAAIATNHMVLSFAKSRIANAGGPNQTGCLTGGVQLNGTLYNTTKGGWSGGSGTYIPNDSTPNARYIPGSGDIIDGTHAASLTFTPAGNPLPGCANISDQVHVYFEIPVTVTASVYSTNTICKDSLQLIASLNKNVTTATWSSSSNHGKFYPSIAVPSGSPYNYYTPVSADYAAGSVYLILTGTVPLSIGCPTVKDSILINLVKPPTVFAGHDTTVCTLSPIVLQHATVTGTTSIQWTTTGGGGFLPHDTTLATTYYPNANGEAASIYIILTTMKGCSTAVDSILVNFVTAPVAKASQSGNNKLLCQGDTIKLNGLVSASVPFNWSTNGTGQFLPDATTLNAAYVPSKADIKKVAIGITLTANLPGCPITKNELLAVILPPPDAGQGTKQQLCPDNSITLSALDPGTDQTGTWTRIAGSGRIVSPGQATTLIDSISVDVNTYKWTVRDTSTGCTNSTIYTVDYCFQPEVTVYNVVSPNNDGMNEFLELENIETYKKNKVIIYNRGGDVVFQMDDYDNAEKVFKGKSNVGFNRDLQDGVYYYLISKGNGGKTQKGFLVLRNDK